MKIDSIRNVSNTIGATAAVVMMAPTLVTALPMSLMCLMAADAPRNGLRQVVACFTLVSGCVIACLGIEAALGYVIKTIIEAALKRFFLDKTPQPAIETSKKV